jgi:hypothetical protein
MALPLPSGAAGRLEPVEDGRFRRALLIPEGIAVRLPLVGENGEPAVLREFLSRSVTLQLNRASLFHICSL